MIEKFSKANKLFFILIILIFYNFLVTIYYRSIDIHFPTKNNSSTVFFGKYKINIVIDDVITPSHTEVKGLCDGIVISAILQCNNYLELNLLLRNLLVVLYYLDKNLLEKILEEISKRNCSTSTTIGDFLKIYIYNSNYGKFYKIKIIYLIFLRPFPDIEKNNIKESLYFSLRKILKMANDNPYIKSICIPALFGTEEYIDSKNYLTYYESWYIILKAIFDTEITNLPVINLVIWKKLDYERKLYVFNSLKKAFLKIKKCM